MTDLQRLKSLLDNIGVGYKIKQHVKQCNDPFSLETEMPDGISLICEEGMAKVEGYGGFCTSFYFDNNENFTNMGAYE